MNTENTHGNENSLRENLLGSEPVKAERLDQLRSQLLQLSGHRLTRRMRIWWSVGFASSIVFAIFGGAVAMAGSIDLPLRIVWWLYTLGNVFVACFAAVILRRRRGEPRLYFWFGLVMVTLAVACCASLLCRAAASPGAEAAMGVGFGEFCVLIDLILFLYGRIVWAHLSTREHLLRLELLILDSRV